MLLVKRVFGELRERHSLSYCRTARGAACGFAGVANRQILSERRTSGLERTHIDLPWAKSETLQSQGMIGGERRQIGLRAWRQEQFSFALRRRRHRDFASPRHGLGEELKPAGRSVGRQFQTAEIAWLRADLVTCKSRRRGTNAGNVHHQHEGRRDGGVAPLEPRIRLGPPRFLDRVVLDHGPHRRPAMAEVARRSRRHVPSSPRPSTASRRCTDKKGPFREDIPPGREPPRPCSPWDTGRRGSPSPGSGRKAGASSPPPAKAGCRRTGPAPRSKIAAPRPGGFSPPSLPASRGPPLIAKRPGNGGQGVLKHRGGVKVEGALLVPLLSIGVVVDPHDGYAEVFHRQQPVRAADRRQIVGESQQAGIRLAERLQVAGLQPVMPAVEVEADAVVQQRPPVGPVDLPLHHPGQAIIGRPAIEEIALRRHAFAEGPQEAGGKRVSPKA